MNDTTKIQTKATRFRGKPAVTLTVANARLHVPIDELRDVADQLHDYADQFEADESAG